MNLHPDKNSAPHADDAFKAVGLAYATVSDPKKRRINDTPARPHTNPLTTKLTNVKDIPFYVSDQFLRTIARDRYQLSQVERMVENSYRGYLADECKTQKAYKRRLESLSSTRRGKTTEAERANLAKKADGFELTRCIELEDLFPQSVMPKDRVKRTHGES